METRAKTRILLADGHHMVRQGIRRLLEGEADFEVVGEADNGLEAVRLTREVKPDVIVMEARISKLDSVEIIRRVKAEHPHAAFLILTASEEEEYVVALVAAGAGGYLLKSAYGDELIQAIRSVRAGDFVCEPALAQKVFKRAAHLPVAVNSAEHLTRRELEVLKLASRGLGNQDIAAQLGIGVRTVRHHLASVFSKMGASSRTDAVLKALKHGWLSLEHQDDCPP
ncbi:MAG: response regulator [Dehalococcoidales bacterium]